MEIPFTVHLRACVRACMHACVHACMCGFSPYSFFILFQDPWTGNGAFSRRTRPPDTGALCRTGKTLLIFTVEVKIATDDLWSSAMSSVCLMEAN